MPKVTYTLVDDNDYAWQIGNLITHDDGITGFEGPVWWIPIKSYLNFVITNGAVLTTTYGEPGGNPEELAKDAKALRLIREAFPNRRVIALPRGVALGVNDGGGGFHCITSQQPRVRQEIRSTRETRFEGGFAA